MRHCVGGCYPIGDGKIVRDAFNKFETLLGGERTQRDVHDVDDFAYGILAGGQLHAASLDLGQVQNIVDQAQEVPPFTWMSIIGSFRRSAPRHRVVEEHLREAEASRSSAYASSWLMLARTRTLTLLVALVHR